MDYVDEYLNHLVIERGLSHNSVTAYSHDLCRFFSWAREKPPDQVAAEDLREHLVWLRREGISARSMTRAMSAIRGYFRFLLEEEIINHDPTALLDRPKLQKSLPGVLSRQEIERLLSAPDLENVEGLRDRAMLELLYAAGLRVSELVGLSLNDIDLEAGVVRAFGKGSKERLVPIGEEAVRWARQYLLTVRPAWAKGRTTNALFLSRRGKGLTRQAVWHRIKHYCLAAGIKG